MRRLCATLALTGDGLVIDCNFQDTDLKQMHLNVVVLRSIILVLCIASSARSQSVRGTVLAADSVTPVVGAVVTVFGNAGEIVVRTRSTGTGRYFLRLPRADRYELSVIRIGYKPARIQLANVSADSVRSLDIVLSVLAIELSAVNISERDDCGTRRTDGNAFVHLWEQVRSALAAPRISEQADGLDIRVLRLEGTQDGSVHLRSGRQLPEVRNRHLEFDSVKAHETYTNRPFATTPAETLAAGGYVRRRPDGSVLFDAPSANALLSDGFLSRHCFGVELGPQNHPEWIGVSFRPIAAVDTLADVAGTIWLDGSNAELRRLEFSYTNLHYLPVETCNGTGKSRQCLLAVASDGDGTGGTMTFAYLPTGEWLISRWTIRTPAEGFKRRPSGTKIQVGSKTGDVCYRGRGCEAVNIPVPQLVVNSGAIVNLARGGIEVYRDDSTQSALSRIALKQAGKAQARITGVITDTGGRPLARAVVSTDAPVRTTITNDSGYFELNTLPAKVIGLMVRKPGYGAVAFHLPLIRDSTRNVRLRLVAIERPR